MMLKFLVCFIFSFLLGSIPTAYLAVKKVKGLDIRQHGSGNVGATNAFRVLGKKYGSLVFLADFLKGAAPAFAAKMLFQGNTDADLLALMVGLAAILGHIFTPFLGFRGGKGVATGSGALCGSYPLLFLCAFAAWALAFLVTRIVSVSSLLSLAALVLASFWLVPDRRATLLFLSLFLLIFWTHRTNIYRLLTGNEYKFDKKQ